VFATWTIFKIGNAKDCSSVVNYRREFVLEFREVIFKIGNAKDCSSVVNYRREFVLEFREVMLEFDVTFA